MTKSNENRTFAWKAITDEIAFRRDRRWKIFSWSAAIQMLIMGGIIALKTDPERLGYFSSQLKVAVFMGATVITFFSIYWIRQNYAVERRAKENLKEYDERLAMNSILLEGPKVGYWHALLLLYIGTCIAALL